jgi:hypothetical protein
MVKQPQVGPSGDNPLEVIVMMGGDSSENAIPLKNFLWDKLWRWKSGTLLMLTLVRLVCVLVSEFLKMKKCFSSKEKTKKLPTEKSL